MYGIARGKPADFDPRARSKRPHYGLENSRADATLANMGLSRFERGLLAFDGLIRRVAKRLQNAAR
jgi:hypothetical protein